MKTTLGKILSFDPCGQYEDAVAYAITDAVAYAVANYIEARKKKWQEIEALYIKHFGANNE